MDELAAARSQCHQTTTSADAYKECLGQAGWTVSELDAVPPPADPRPPLARTEFPPQTLEAHAANGAVTVKTWWRIDAGQSNLGASVEACASQLGLAETPAPGYHTVSRPLYDCLTRQGWRGST